MKKEALFLPQLGVNDVDAKIIEWKKESGDIVRKGDIVCVVETTKATFDVESTSDGHMITLRDIGEEVAFGDVLAVVSESVLTLEEAASFAAAVKSQFQSAAPDSTEGPFAVTEKARLLALRKNIDVSKIRPHQGDRVTEAEVLKYMESSLKGETANELRDTVEDVYPSNRIQRLAVLGAGDGAVQIMDALAKIPHQRAVMLFDDNKSIIGRAVVGVPVVGAIDIDEIERRFKNNEFEAAIISISTSIPFRYKAYEALKHRGVPFANVIHPSATVGINSKLGTGNVVLAFCQIGACTAIGDNNFMSAYCSIEHHSVLESHCSFGPGVVTSSRVHIGNMVRCGTGIFIEPHITIGDRSIVSSGCIIWKDIPSDVIAKSQLNYVIRKVG
jgi:sugar O-acyltransferase (sialic acid O-acetyltransferase NeuD family)